MRGINPIDFSKSPASLKSSMTVFVNGAKNDLVGGVGWKAGEFVFICSNGRRTGAGLPDAIIAVMDCKRRRVSLGFADSPLIYVW